MERRAAVHHRCDVLVLRRKPPDTNVVECSIGDCFTHPIDLIARDSFLHEIVVRILALLYAGVDEFLHGCTDGFVSDLVIFGHQFL